MQNDTLTVKLSERLTIPLDLDLRRQLEAEALAEKQPLASEARRILVLGLAAKRAGLTPAAGVAP